MEIYVLTALVFIYIVTAAAGGELLTRRIWALALVVSVLLMTLALGALRLNNEDVMLSAGQFNWYYFLYMFSALTAAVGFINLWIYRRELWNLCRKDGGKE